MRVECGKMIYFLVGPGALIVILSVIAWRLQKQVRQQELQRRQQLEEAEKEFQKRHDYINNSIQILAQGIIDDQVTLTEGAIRISVLMDNLKSSEQHREEFNAIFQLASLTSHIPILDAWKKLSKQEQFRYEKERLDTESKYQDFVIDAARRIKGRSFD